MKITHSEKRPDNSGVVKMLMSGILIVDHIIFGVLLGPFNVCSAEWDMPLQGGQIHDVASKDETAYVAWGRSGLAAMQFHGGKLTIRSMVLTPGAAIRAFPSGKFVWVFTDRRILQPYRIGKQVLTPKAPIFLGAWDLVDLAVSGGRLFYLRKEVLKKTIRDRETTLELFFIGSGRLTSQGMRIEGEAKLGAIRPHQLLPIRSGRWAVVTLGTSGLAVVDFEMPSQPRVTDFVSKVGDVRTLSFVSDRVVAAGGPNQVVTLDWDTYLEDKANPSEKGLPDIDFEKKEEDDDLDGVGAEAANPLRAHPVKGMPVSFYGTEERFYAALDTGVIVSFVVPELGSDVSKEGEVLKLNLSRTAGSKGEPNLSRSARTTRRAMRQLPRLASVGKQLLTAGSDGFIRLFKLEAEPKELAAYESGPAPEQMTAGDGKTCFFISGTTLLQAKGATVQVVKRFTAPPRIRFSKNRLFCLGERPSIFDPATKSWKSEEHPAPQADIKMLLREFAGAQGKALETLGPGRLVDFDWQEGRLFLLQEDVFEEPGRRPVTRSSLSVLEQKDGRIRLAGQYRAEGGARRHLSAGRHLAAVTSRGHVELIDWRNGKVAGTVFVGPLNSLALTGQRLMVSGPGGLRVYDIANPDRPLYLSNLRRPEILSFGINEDSFFGFTGNRLFAEARQPARKPEALTAIQLTPFDGQINSGHEIAEHYGRSFTILDGGVDVCSEKYQQMRGYRLRPVRVNLSDASGWPDVRIDPDTIGIDPTSGRVKFSDGTASTFERLSAVATPMYNSTGWDIRGDRIYVATGENANPFVIYDIADPSFPKEVAWCPGSVRFPHDIAVTEDNRIAYLPVGDGLDITDVTDVRGSAYERVKTPAKRVCTWAPPRLGKDFQAGVELRRRPAGTATRPMAAAGRRPHRFGGGIR
ncbi:MAG: hypothetical protein QGF00_19155 [Planctomycetota bacterium]|nr:hypothetical protein [Planctomycetota bacterium]